MVGARRLVSSPVTISKTLLWGRWMMSTAVSGPTAPPPTAARAPHVASLSIRSRDLKTALRDQNATAIRSILKAVEEVVEPLPVTLYNSLLTACAREGNAQVARDVYALMRGHGVQPNATSHTRFSRALCRSGHPSEALDHVEGLGGRGGVGPLPAFNTILNACGQTRDQWLADRCLTAMQRQGVVPDAQTYVELMRLAGAQGDEAGIDLYWRQLAQVGGEQPPPLPAYTARVHALASCHDLTRAVQALQDLGHAALRAHVEDLPPGSASSAEAGHKSGPGSPATGRVGPWWADPSAALLSDGVKEEVRRSYNAVMSALAGRGEGERVAVLVAQMQRGGVALDSYSYNAWMRVSAKQGQVDDMLRVRRHMSRACVPPTSHSHDALVLALCKGGRVEDGEEALKEMGPSASVHGYNAVIKAWVDKGEGRRALDSYRDLKGAGLNPDRCTFLALLAASGGPRAAGLTPGEWAEGEVAAKIEAVEEEMVREGVQHDERTATALIQAYGREGMVGPMLGRLRGWQGGGLLGEAAYNSAISACCKHQQMEVAQELLQEMATEGVEPSLVTFNAVLNGCSYGGEVQTAGEVMEEVRGRGLVPDACTYNSLIKVCCHAGDMEGAVRAMEEMEGSGVRADGHTFETIIAGAGHNKRMDVMEFVVEHMHRARVAPTAFVCGEMVGGYVEMGQKEEAVAALRVLGQRMKEAEGEKRGNRLGCGFGGEGVEEGRVGEDGDEGWEVERDEDDDGAPLRMVLENVVGKGKEVGLGAYLMRVGEELDEGVGPECLEESAWAVRVRRNYVRC